MAGRVPGTSVFERGSVDFGKTWIAGTSPATGIAGDPMLRANAV
jgi:hypothetical protein